MRGDRLMTEFGDKVMKWIERNFDTTTIEISDYHLPHSKVIKLQNGKKKLIYWDFANDKIIESEF